MDSRFIKSQLQSHDLTQWFRKGDLNGWTDVLLPRDVFFTLSGEEIRRGDQIQFTEPELPLCLSKNEILAGWLIPKTSHASSLAKILTRNSWNEIRREILKATNNVCISCGIREKSLDVHEVWSFGDFENTSQRLLCPQTLLTLIPVCQACHAAAHASRIWDLGESVSKLERAEKTEELFNAPMSWLQQINLWDDETAFNYRSILLKNWHNHNFFNFFLNCALINDQFPELVLEVRDTWQLSNSILFETSDRSHQTLLVGVKWRFANETKTYFFREKRE